MTFEKEYVSYEELYEAYLDCRSRKASTANCIQFEMDLDYNLYKLWKELNSFQYEIGRSICFVVEFRREVFAADFRDRIVHHLIIRRILNIIEKKWFILDNYSCREEKGVLFGVNRFHEQLKQCTDNFTKDATIYKGDLRNCFNKLSKTKIYNLLEKFLKENIFDEDELKFNLHVIKLIIFNDATINCIRKQPKCFFRLLDSDKSMFNLEKDFGMAVGNLTTQIFANFFLTLIDRFIKDVLHIKYYGRYVDDFYMIHEDKEYLKKCVKLLKEFLLTIGLEIHPKKQYMQYYKKGVNFTGYKIYPNNIQSSNKIKKKFIKTLKEFIAKCDKYLEEYGLFMSLYEADDYVKSINAYISMLIYFDSTWLVEEQFKNEKLQTYLLQYYKINKNYTLRYNSFTKRRLRNFYEVSLAA